MGCYTGLRANVDVKTVTRLALHSKYVYKTVVAYPVLMSPSSNTRTLPIKTSTTSTFTR